MPTEIETKYAVASESRQQLMIQLSEMCQQLTSEKHRDEYFEPRLNPYTSTPFPYEWLSIRQRGDRCSLNYKHFYPEGAEVHSYADEYETEVGDATTLRTLLVEGLGFKSIAVVQKHRNTFEYRDEYVLEIAVDDVNHLGVYIEFEIKSRVDDINTAKQYISRLAASLSLEEAVRDNRGYPFRVIESELSLNPRFEE